MTKVWCVRGEFGKLTPDFLKGGVCGDRVVAEQ